MAFNKKLDVPRPVSHEYQESVIHTQPRMDDLDLTELNIPDESRGSFSEQRVERPMASDFMEQEPHHKKVLRDNTLFVKIDMYKESMRTLNLIKESLMNTENILNKLHKIKDEEDAEIKEWHDEIRRIKQKVMFIDKNLFENE